MKASRLVQTLVPGVARALAEPLSVLTQRGLGFVLVVVEPSTGHHAVESNLDRSDVRAVAEAIAAQLK